MSYTPKTYLLITWPESQRIMNHPEAKLIDDNDNREPNCYIVPPKIWEQYKNTYYKDKWNSEEEMYTDKTKTCVECNELRSLDHIMYCDKCTQPVCDYCYENATKRGVRCYNCKLGETRTPPD